METARESVPHFSAVVWDTVSRWADFGKRVPEFAPRTGYSFPDGGIRKVHPGIYV